MLKRLDLRGVTGGDLRASLPRPEAAKEPPVAAVQAILADVRSRGDAAVRECTERFDGVSLDGFRVPQSEIDDA
ncbi:MAG: histidinol dehydrogenase, partial [Actinomycetota bacterium]|nr:histidinol dehydrogenase [Actinomycetota bacterium]